MKKNFLFFIFFVVFSVTAHAQLFNNSKPVSADSVIKQLPAQLFTQLLNSVKPNSFTSAFAKQKKTLLATAAKTKDPATVAKNISSFISFIKPEMFKTGFNIPGLLTAADGSKTMPAAMSVLKNLEDGLKAEAISDIWKLQRNNWMADINKIK
jgi:hypothetical protein